ncbi:MAG: FMN-binding protein [Gemmatimonadetes bacterium]|jgi:Na+-translocating ferredoxin:NAD+ oxidoreductase subunit G|nr:FMN-binding protein [Gemmatimonadota bacterium]MBT6147459.1 FMN-binding protein [Gemmatimonadota bacterium]MBT7858931.1 FMN-binding protein [Gemmatimonadota bacterium]
MTTTSTVDIQPAPALPNSWHMIRSLGGVGVLCSLLIVLTYQWTLPIIEQNKAEALARAIYNVLPGAEVSATYQIGADEAITTFEGKATGSERLVYAGYDAEGQLVGVAVEAAGQGFQDVIRILYGYTPVRQQVIGMEVLESKETPGLGDKIIKDATFVANFEALDVHLDETGLSLRNSVVAVKSGKKENPWEVDGITGATISSVAVADIIDASARATLPALLRQLDQLRRPPSQQPETQRSEDGTP